MTRQRTAFHQVVTAWRPLLTCYTYNNTHGTHIWWHDPRDLFEGARGACLAARHVQARCADGLGRQQQMHNSIDTRPPV